jgi:hypothetical protein
MESKAKLAAYRLGSIGFNVAMTFQSWKGPPIYGLYRCRNKRHFREVHQNGPGRDGRSPHLDFDLEMLLVFRALPGVFITT